MDTKLPDLAASRLMALIVAPAHVLFVVDILGKPNDIPLRWTSAMVACG